MKYAPIKFEYAENLEPFEKVVKKRIADDLLEALQCITVAAENIGGEHVTGLAGLGNGIEMAYAAISKALGEE